jgi:uncharacterized delta-60 repeat protein
VIAAVAAGTSVAVASFAGDGKETFNLGGVDSARALAIQKDDRIVVAGSTTVGAPPFDIAVARFEADGDVDNTFSGNGFEVTDAGGFDGGDDVAIQRNGRIVVAGSADIGGSGANDFAVARYLETGSPDPAFSDDGLATTGFDEGASARAVAIQRNGRIVVAGGKGDDFALARYRPNGNLDRSFSGDGRQKTNLGGFDSADAVAIQRDGRIVVAGDSCIGPGMGCASNFALARYLPDGKLDKSFSKDGKARPNIGGSDSARDVAIQRDGRIVAVGAATPGPEPVFATARLLVNGKLDKSFSGDGRKTTGFGDNANANAVAIARNGRIVVVGSTQATPTVDSVVIRYRPNGALDKSFSSDGKVTTDIAEGAGDTAQDVAFQTRRKFVTTGGISPSNDFYVARYRANGELDD